MPNWPWNQCPSPQLLSREVATNKTRPGASGRSPPASGRKCAKFEAKLGAASAGNGTPLHNWHWHHRTFHFFLLLTGTHAEGSAAVTVMLLAEIQNVEETHRTIIKTYLNLTLYPIRIRTICSNVLS